MDYKVLTYLLYLAVTVPLTIFVARTLYGNGKVFLQDVFDGDERLAEAVNRLLVVGFYLLNLGYVALFLKTGNRIAGGQQMLEVLSQRVGIVAIVLGTVHLANVWVFNLLRRRALDAAEIHSPVAAAERTTVVANPWGAPR